MNKTAPKEPSMDEILSSIRQIIADDDAATTPRRPPIPAGGLGAALAAAPAEPAPYQPQPALPQREPQLREPQATAAQPLAASMPRVFQRDERVFPREEPARPELAPLDLSPEQIVPADDEGGAGPAPTPSIFASLRATPAPAEPESTPPPLAPEQSGLVDPEDVSFDFDDEPEPEPAPPMARPSFSAPAHQAPRPSVRVAEAAPMPDRTLSRDLAEQLIEPATNAAVRHNFSRLSALSVGTPGLTVEDMIRDMLRPMLKDWLDENLPAMVERLVEKEIARISRGVE